ncbi:MAG: pitrilysin family protein [Candidatus Aminicenantes bacterium]|jgi:predicted Zn-dependent peptidase
MCFWLAVSSSAQDRFRREAPDPDPLPVLNLPNIESYTLSNGLDLTVVRMEKTPFIYLRMIINDGEGSSPENLPGLATFAAHMLNKGASNLSSSQIEETIESIGGYFSSVVYPDYSIFSFSFLEEHLEEALDILSKMILEPDFLRLEIDLAKGNMRYNLLEDSADPEFLAKKIFYQLIFQNHRYQSMGFNDDVIKNFSRDALISYFDKHYKPNNSRIILIGNINLQTAARKVSHYFNTWKRADLEKEVVTAPKPNDKTRICYVEIQKTRNATIFIGNTFSPEIKGRFIPFLVFNQVLGGTENSRLIMNLRESKSYAFWAYSEIELYKTFGLFYVRAMVQPEAVHPSVTEILGEIQKTTQERIPNSDIEQAKSYLIGHFPLTIQNMDQFAQKVSKKAGLNLGDEYWEDYYENMMLVNSDDVFDAVRKSSLLTPLVIIVGDSNTLESYMNEFDEVEVYDKYGNLRYTLKKGEDL